MKLRHLTVAAALAAATIATPAAGAQYVPDCTTLDAQTFYAVHCAASPEPEYVQAPFVASTAFADVVDCTNDPIFWLGAACIPNPKLETPEPERLDHWMCRLGDDAFFGGC